MNQNQQSLFSKGQESLLEDGELADNTLLTSIYLDSSQDVQQLTSQLQNLSSTNPGFIGTKKKRRSFNPDSFQEVKNVKLKDGNHPSHIQNAAQRQDAVMQDNDEETPDLQKEEVQVQEANIIRNEDSFDYTDQPDDKADGNSDFSNNQIDRYMRQKGMSPIKRNSFKTTKSKIINSNSSLQNQVQTSFNKPAPFNFGFEEVKESRERVGFGSNNNTGSRQPTNNQNTLYHHSTQQAGPNLQITTQDFAQLMRSKQEIYGILLNQGQYFLPPYQECTIEFLRDVFAGRKRLLTTSSVRIVNVPKLNELTVTNLIEQVKQDPQVMLYLPELKDKRSVNRQYLYNIINTIKPEFFPDNIRAGLEMRKQRKSFENKKYIEIQSDIYSLLQGAVNLNPSTRGRALHLLNVGAKKRKRPERGENIYKQPQYSLREFTVQHEGEIQQSENLNKRKKFNNDSLGQQQVALNRALIQPKAQPVSTLVQSMIQPQTFNQ